MALLVLSPLFTVRYSEHAQPLPALKLVETLERESLFLHILCVCCISRSTFSSHFLWSTVFNQRNSLRFWLQPAKQPSSSPVSLFSELLSHCHNVDLGDFRFVFSQMPLRLSEPLVLLNFPGFTAITATNPIWLIKTRLQLETR